MLKKWMGSFFPLIASSIFLSTTIACSYDPYLENNLVKIEDVYISNKDTFNLEKAVEGKAKDALITKEQLGITLPKMDSKIEIILNISDFYDQVNESLKVKVTLTNNNQSASKEITVKAGKFKINQQLGLIDPVFVSSLDSKIFKQEMEKIPSGEEISLEKLGIIIPKFDDSTIKTTLTVIEPYTTFNQEVKVDFRVQNSLGEVLRKSVVIRSSQSRAINFIDDYVKIYLTNYSRKVDEELAKSVENLSAGMAVSAEQLGISLPAFSDNITDIKLIVREKYQNKKMIVQVTITGFNGQKDLKNIIVNPKISLDLTKDLTKIKE